MRKEFPVQTARRMQDVTEREQKARQMMRNAIGTYIWSDKDLAIAVLFGIGFGVILGWMF